MNLNDDRIYKLIDKNPRLISYQRMLDNHNTIIIMEPKVKRYTQDPIQHQIPGYTEGATISEKMIVDMFRYDDSYRILKRIYNDKESKIFIFYLGENGDYIRQFSLYRGRLNKIFGFIDINKYPEIKDRYNEIMGIISYDNYMKNHNNDIYKISVDNIDYEIKVSDIFKILTLSDEEFNNIMDSDDDTLYGYPISVFMYAVKKYFDDNQLFDNYLVDDKTKKRYREISSSENIDIEMVNQYLDNEDPLLSGFTVDSELEKEILGTIPSDFNELEKAIYVYIKMCKLLTYDEEFFAVKQNGPLSIKHKLIENISKITLTNNKVVCYEFNSMFAYFLNKLGIKYQLFIGTVDGNGLHGEQEFSPEYNWYSEGHVFLKFRSGKFLVSADAVVSIIDGDMVQAKLNQPLKGLRCRNVNVKSSIEFFEARKRVYDYIASQENKISNNEVDKYESFEDALKGFREQTDKKEEVSFDEKLEILIEKINKSKLIGVDAYSYLLQLSKVLFTKEEKKENIKITIIRSYDSMEQLSARGLAVISIRKVNSEGEGIITRYLFTPGDILRPITLEELKERFDSGLYGYIDKDDPLIPGIKR